MVDKKIETALNTLDIPISRVFHTRKDGTFIFWQYITSIPSNYADDDYETIDHTLRVHIFAKQNYTKLLEKTLQALKKAGFTINSIDNEIFEEETNYFHRPITISIMEEQKLCN